MSTSSTVIEARSLTSPASTRAKKTVPPRVPKRTPGPAMSVRSSRLVPSLVPQWALASTKPSTGPRRSKPTAAFGAVAVHVVDPGERVAGEEIDALAVGRGEGRGEGGEGGEGGQPTRVGDSRECPFHRVRLQATTPTPGPGV